LICIELQVQPKRANRRQPLITDFGEKSWIKAAGGTAFDSNASHQRIFLLKAQTRGDQAQNETKLGKFNPNF
jgi:hypothetical protein